MNLPKQTTRQYEVLRLLFTSGGMTQQQVADHLGMKSASLCGTIMPMVHKGLVEIAEDSQSTKVKYIASMGARRLFNCDRDGEIVQPRQVNVLNTPPLHPSRYLTNVARREGSDSRVYKSKHV